MRKDRRTLKICEQSGYRYKPTPAILLKGAWLEEWRFSANMLEMLGGKKEKKAASSKTIKLPAEVYERYFTNVKADDVAGIVEEALAAWYGKGGMVGVP